VQLEALAHCYGFLAANGAMPWERVEAAVTRPYSSLTFWRFAGSPYRYMAVTMLAVAVQVRQFRSQAWGWYGDYVILRRPRAGSLPSHVFQQ
jgi:hypothetical protein